jgi:hypothetical protein
VSTPPYCVGSVWWGLIDFKDGQGERKKYFVLLNDCLDAGEQFVAAITTSRVSRYPERTASPCGFPTYPCFRIDEDDEACFKEPTFVQFDNAFHIGQSGLDAHVRSDRAGFLQELARERTRSILNCAKKSIDIAKRDLELIGRTLKALSTAAKAASAPGKAKPTTPTVRDSAIGDIDRRFRRCCLNCRSEFAGLMSVAEDGLAKILSGSTSSPPDFVRDAGLAFDLIAAKCTCLVVASPES